MKANFDFRIVKVLLVSCCMVCLQLGHSQAQNSPFVLSQKVGELEVQIDYRIEAITVIQLLADYPFVTAYKTPFREKVLKHFASLKSHPAVNYMKENWNKGVAYEKPIFMVLLLGNDLKPAFDLPANVNRIVGGQKAYESFAEKFADFYRSKEFESFLKNNHDFYKQLLLDVVPAIESCGALGPLTAYYGYAKPGFRIVISPLQIGGGYGPSIQTAADTFMTYNVMGPRDWSPEKGFNFGNQRSFKYLIWHEFSHSYLNPMVDQNWEAFSTYNELFKPISKEMTNMSYGSWNICLYEHLVRTATICLVSNELSKEEGAELIKDEISRGFIYIPGLMDAFQHYEGRRESFSRIDSLVPIILTVLDQYKEGSRIAQKNQEIQYIQSVRGDEDRFLETGYPNINYIASCIRKEGGYLILPTDEKDPKIQAKIHQNAKAFWTKVAKMEVLTDDEALSKGNLDKHVVALGTPQGNLWIKNNLKQLPIGLNENQIQAASKHVGENQRLIVGAPILPDHNKYMLIYTAQQVEAIIGIQGVPHGGECYTIAKDQEVQESGFFWIEGEKLIVKEKK